MRIAVTLGIFLAAIVASGQVPSSQRIPLVPGSTIGVVGGIPSPFANVSNVVAYGADPTGNTSSTAAIQNLLNTVPDNTTVYFPPGLFDIRGGVSIERNNILINGAGTNSILLGNIVIGRDGGAVTAYGANYSLAVSNTIPLTVGDTNMVFVVNQDGSGNTVSVGDAFQISSSIYSSDLSNFQYIATQGGEYGATFGHILAQEVYITGVSGSTYSFWPPLAWNFTNAPIAFPRNFLEHDVHSIYQMKTNIGLANFTLTGSNSPSLTSPQTFQLSIDMVNNFYMTNVNVLWCNNHNIYLIDAANCEFIGNWVAWNFLPPGSNQGALLLYSDTGIMIENNVFEGGFPAIEIDNPSVGVAIFANMFTNNFAADVFDHISHNIMIDFEDNVCGASVQVDGYFGSCSHHIFNRNVIRGTLSLKRFSTYMAAVGNVMGDPNFYRSYMDNRNNYTGITGGYTIFEIGYPGRGNENYDNVSPPEPWNFPGGTFSGFNTLGVSNNGYFAITNTQLNTNLLVGSFTNLPSDCTGDVSCGQMTWVAQDTSNTNLYWPLGVTTNNSTYNESSNLQFGANVSVTNGQRMYVTSQNGYQWLQQSNQLLSTLLTGNVLATNASPTNTVTVWDSTGVVPITNSYVYSQKPGWWGTNHWPPIGPDATPVAGLIPAQERFLGMAIGLPDIRTLAPAGPF